jgi:hypothetical protein
VVFTTYELSIFPLSYTDENGYTVRIEKDGSETVFYDTISVVGLE